jgi:hypothetical protein
MTRLTVLVITLAFTLAFFAGCNSGTQISQNQVDSSSIVVASEDHEYSVQIEGREMKNLTIKQVADLWGIDAQKLLDGIVTEFKVKNSYTINSVLDTIRNEYKFSPAMVKAIAEKIKSGGSI